MHRDGIDLLKLMFNPGETVCASPNQFGYHSLVLEDMIKDQVLLLPTVESCEKRKIKWEDAFENCASDDLLLVALNPCKGWRLDSNVYKFRSFLVEMDTGTGTAADLLSQANYIRKYDLPYSACIFSGGKSLHYLITLDEDLETEQQWRHIAQWILSALPMADQFTKNPTRGIRIPGAFRAEKGKYQELQKLGKRISQKELLDWLHLFPGAEPKIRERKYPSETPDVKSLKPWVLNLLEKGLDPTKGRNAQWYSVAFEFCLAGYSEDATIRLLANYFRENRDFKEKEWLTTIRSAFKHVHERR